MLGAIEASGAGPMVAAGAGLAAVVVAVLTAGAALAAATRLGRGTSPPPEADRVLVLVAGALVMALGIHGAGQQLLGLRYPNARGWLWVIPLSTLAVVLAISPGAVAPRRAWAVSAVRAAWVAGLCLAYALQLQASTFRDYSYDAASRTIFERIRSVLGNAGNRAVVVAAPSFQCPSFDFYRITEGVGWPASCREAKWPDEGGWDARILRLEDLAGERPPDGARELFRDAVSGTVVLVREEGAKEIDVGLGPSAFPRGLKCMSPR